MVPVMQTRFGRGGNCLAACVASILDRPLADLDFSCADYPQIWDDVLRGKLAPIGYTFAHVVNYPREKIKVFGSALYIAHGFTDRDPPWATPSERVQHAVVMSGSLLIHDPHPDNIGLIATREVSFILPLNFARFQRCDHPTRT
jgi:hypothetical protein